LKADQGIKLRDQLLARPTVAGRLGTPVAPLANATLASRPLRTVAEKLVGLDRGAAMPKFAGRTFQSWARKHPKPAGATKRVAYFHACGTNYYEPRLGEMLVEVLEHNGFAVDVPRRQDCCGLPAQSNGIFDLARKYARRMAKVLAPAARELDIVANSTSCSLMLQREAREILSLDDDPELRLVSERMFDICEYLLGLHDRGELRTDFKPLPMRVTYHAPCQQQGHGIGKPAIDLLGLIPELEVRESDATCCGVAGTYGLKREKRQIAMDVGAGLFRQVAEDGSELSVCDSETCRWHIEQATGIPSVHPVELLHRAYGL
jgi:glycerol-3-phosphate dehydrogenase subunit C